MIILKIVPKIAYKIVHEIVQETVAQIVYEMSPKIVHEPSTKLYLKLFTKFSMKLSQKRPQTLNHTLNYPGICSRNCQQNCPCPKNCPIRWLILQFWKFEIMHILIIFFSCFQWKTRFACVTRLSPVAGKNYFLNFLLQCILFTFFETPIISQIHFWWSLKPAR